MQITRVFVVLATLLVVGYAAIEPLDLEAEESNVVPVHSRQKRTILTAKLGLLGGALVAKKALLLGAGAGLVGGVIGGAKLLRFRNELGNGYGSGYPGLYGSSYPGGYGSGYPGGYGSGLGIGYGGPSPGGNYGAGIPIGYYPLAAYPIYAGGANLAEGAYPGASGAYPRKTYQIYGGISGGYDVGNGYSNGYGNGYNNYQPC